MTDKASELEMFSFFERTPVLVCIAGRDGYFRKVNPAVIDKLGYTESELFAVPISSFVYKEDKLMTEQERTKLLEGKTLMNFQNRYVAKNGNLIWLEWTSVYLSEKEVVFAIASDISERKQVEIEIEDKYTTFRSLATHFKSSIEQDRKYLAVELHEELAQLAAVVKMDIDMVSNSAATLTGEEKTMLDHASTITKLLINTIRRISFSISPKMLDEIGLDETLKWHCNEFALLNGIPCTFKGKYNENDLTPEVKLDFFRICQEALSNVMYHAQATRVEISLEDTGKTIRLTIADDGKGYNVHQQKETSGLRSIKDRVISINGELNIESEPGKGVSISVEIQK